MPVTKVSILQRLVFDQNEGVSWPKMGVYEELEYALLTGQSGIEKRSSIDYQCYGWPRVFNPLVVMV